MSPTGPESGSWSLGRGLDDLLAKRTDPWSDDPIPVGENSPSGQDDRGLHQRDLADFTPENYPHGVVDNLPLGSITPNEYQPRTRFDEDALASLTESVRSMGVLQPILVRARPGGGFELIAGERRWRAARRAGLETIPAIIRSIDDQRSLEEAIVENLHRADLNPIEEAAAYAQLMEEFALTQDEVAERVGKSRSAVANTLRLTQLPGAVQRMIMMGELSAGHARALLVLADPGEQRELAERVLAEGLSVRQVEALVKPSNRDGDGAAKSSRSRSGASGKKSASALEIEDRLGDRFDTRVEVFETMGTGRIVVNFADGDDLARIYELMLGDR